MSNGEDIKLAEPETKTEGDSQVGAPEPDSGKLPPPEHGFDETGKYFVARIHTGYGFLAIMGFLEASKDFLKAHISRQMQEAKKKSIIHPGSTKGFGRFNPFKR